MVVAVFVVVVVVVVVVVTAMTNGDSLGSFDISPESNQNTLSAEIEGESIAAALT